MQPFISKLPINIGLATQFTTPMLFSINKHHHVDQDPICGPSPTVRCVIMFAHLHTSTKLQPTFSISSPMLFFRTPLQRWQQPFFSTIINWACT